jgi:hypothetical protein
MRNGWASSPTSHFGRLAQLGEHQLDKLGVTGSSPVPPTSKTRWKRRVFLVSQTRRTSTRLTVCKRFCKRLPTCLFKTADSRSPVREAAALDVSAHEPIGRTSPGNGFSRLWRSFEWLRRHSPLVRRRHAVGVRTWVRELEGNGARGFSAESNAAIVLAETAARELGVLRLGDALALTAL